MKWKVIDNWQLHALQLQVWLKNPVDKQLIFQHLLHTQIGKWCLVNFHCLQGHFFTPTLAHCIFPERAILIYGALHCHDLFTLFNFQLIDISCTSLEAVVQFGLVVFCFP